MRFQPGDRIALARPGYVAYRNTLRALHLEPVEIACGAETRFQLTAAQLEALEPAPAGVIIASPANPTSRQPAMLQYLEKLLMMIASGANCSMDGVGPT